MKTRSRALFLGAALGLSVAAQAAVPVAWSTVGDVLVGGDQALQLSTAYAAPGDPDTPYNLSGTSAANIVFVEAAAGVAAQALDLPDDGWATEGSFAGLSLTVQAGDRLRFDWGFETLDTEALDHAFVVLDGQVQTLATAGASQAPSPWVHVFDQAGTVQFGVGVVDTVDVLGVSTLYLSGLQVSPVPEPAAAWTLLAGLVGLAGVRHAAARRRASRPSHRPG